MKLIEDYLGISAKCETHWHYKTVQHANIMMTQQPCGDINLP